MFDYGYIVLVVLNIARILILLLTLSGCVSNFIDNIRVPLDTDNLNKTIYLDQNIETLQ